MKKAFIILFTVLLLAVCPFAHAESELPPEMRELYVASHEATEYADGFLFDMPDGSDMSVIQSASYERTINIHDSLNCAM